MGEEKPTGDGNTTGGGGGGTSSETHACLVWVQGNCTGNCPNCPASGGAR
jgi:hypothetical protein